MQVVLNKKEKEELVIKLYQDGKPIREIARQAHLSFGSIGKIIRTINSDSDDNCSTSSKSTKALRMFKNGKKPIEVAIELDISASEVEELQQEFWALNQLHELGFLFNEIKNYLPSFIKLFNLLKSNKMLGDGYISKFLRYADYDLPFLEDKIQKLTGDIIELEWKKRDLNNTITLWNAQLRDLGQTMEHYQKAIEIKKQQLMRTEKRAP
jgi:DNA-binding CsgD family transcriptional regulator